MQDKPTEQTFCVSSIPNHAAHPSFGPPFVSLSETRLPSDQRFREGVPFGVLKEQAQLICYKHKHKREQERTGPRCLSTSLSRHQGLDGTRIRKKPPPSPKSLSIGRNGSSAFFSCQDLKTGKLKKEEYPYPPFSFSALRKHQQEAHARLTDAPPPPVNRVVEVPGQNVAVGGL